MKNFDKLFESQKQKIQIIENKYKISDIKTVNGKKIYTILNDAKSKIKNEIELLFKKSDPNRGAISNTVVNEMPDFVELVGRLERIPTFKDSFEEQSKDDSSISVPELPDDEDDLESQAGENGEPSIEDEDDE